MRSSRTIDLNLLSAQAPFDVRAFKQCVQNIFCRRVLEVDAYLAGKNNIGIADDEAAFHPFTENVEHFLDRSFVGYGQTQSILCLGCDDS